MVVIWMLLLLLLWANLCQHINKKRWAAINSVIFGLSAATILYATILTRTPGVPEAVLAPFASLTAARQQPELYRAMLMNVFLFFPLGLTLSNALPRKWHRWGRIAFTTLIGCILSAGIEYAQYRCALGLAETDDVICNTLGAFLGATSLLAAHAIEKSRERVRHTNMTLTTTETQFLHIAKAAISGGDLPAEKADWPAIFTLANQQKLLPILFEAVRKMPAAEENVALFAVTKQQVIGQVLNQTVRSAEFADLYRKLRSAGLHPIVVKGQLCSRLYPLKDHRISADDDLYISDAEFMACHKQLLANGLTTDTPVDELDTADEVSYTKNGSPLYIELHRHLFDSSEDTHDELNHFLPTSSPSKPTVFSPCRPTSICCTCFCTPTSTLCAAASVCGSFATSACGRGRITGRSTGSACASSARASTRQPLLRRRFTSRETISASNLTCLRRGTAASTWSRCCTTASAAACTAPTT